MKLSWSEFNTICDDLGSALTKVFNEGKLRSIYGIPRGGSIVAQRLSAKFGFPMCEEGEIDNQTLIVDDIVDSGKTISKFPHNYKACLFINPEATFFGELFLVREKKEWVEFPYEIGAKENPGEDGVVRMLQAIGENPGREGLLDTPKRVTKSWAKLYAGYSQNPEEVLKTTFSEVENYDQLITLTDIELYSTCEHHMLPFFGKAHIGYLPNKKVVGLSKLARVVEIFSRRLQIQERLTQEIGNAINECLKPQGVGVIIEAQHFCMMARGVEKQNSKMTTSCLIGSFRNECRDEFLKLCFK